MTIKYLPLIKNESNKDEKLISNHNSNPRKMKVAL